MTPSEKSMITNVRSDLCQGSRSSRRFGWGRGRSNAHYPDTPVENLRADQVHHETGGGAGEDVQPLRQYSESPLIL
jgi:hypothetical protein